MKYPAYQGVYCESNLNHIAFPLGGIGAGMFCMRGTGMPGCFSLRHAPDVYNQPNLFAALTVISTDGNISRVLEGQVPRSLIFGAATDDPRDTGGNGHGSRNYGLPRFEHASFSSRFPFATVDLTDDAVPLNVSLTGWSPFTPPDPDDSSYPLAYLEYTFRNTGNQPCEAVFYFSSMNFLKQNDTASVTRYDTGFILRQPPVPEHPESEAAFCAFINDAKTGVDTGLFRGGWFDPLSILWNKIERAEHGHHAYSDSEDHSSPGASLSLPFALKPGEAKTIRIHCAWYVPKSGLRTEGRADPVCDCGGDCAESKTYRPWYTIRFAGIEEVIAFSQLNANRLFTDSQRFTHTFYAMDLPSEVMEAVSANLSILKSPTVLRQTDGRLWAWEGCCDKEGCCAGSCTHVWNYAQALCHLFPVLERSLRETEFTDSQNDEGHQQFRSMLPIREAVHNFHAAAHGQLGGIIKLYRDYTLSGNIDFLRRLFPYARQSMDYCIKTWDPERRGVLTEPHHNTYDIEFWGADGMCSSFYLGALKAMDEMGKLLDEEVSDYRVLYAKGRIYMESHLYNGAFFTQDVQWEQLHTKMEDGGDSAFSTGVSPEAVALAQKEGPKYQYGAGCLSDGVLGVWMAELAGLHDILDPEKVRSHLRSVYDHNFKRDLRRHANPQRGGFALGNEGGLLLCTWPNGGKPSLPFVYSDEVWTGIEYQAASHMIMAGETQAGLEIVRACRNRYDGEKRNPFDEYECGHWYARAMASYALIEALTGVRYDAAKRILTIRPRMERFTSFLAAESGYALCHWDGENATLEVIKGKLEVAEIYVLRD